MCVALAGTIGALALPVAAQASTKQVFMGVPPTAQKAFAKYDTDVNGFFPSATTIHVGDKVRFIPVGFHDVDFPAKGAGPVPFNVPNGQKVADAIDAAGVPFWFNGQDMVGLNPALFPNLYGKGATYNGKSRVVSGLPLGDKPGPATLTFSRKGTFTYHCDIHEGMKGKVNVVAKTAKAPTAKDDAKVVKRMVARDLAIAQSLVKKTVPAATVDVGEAGSFGVEFLGFLPRNLTVPTGTALTFRMTKGSFDAHTATTGPGDPETEPDSYLGKLAKSYESPVTDPAGLYPSDPAGAPASLTPQTHGNGFWNSGRMDTAPSSPSPSSNSVRFDAPGTYEVYCLVHQFMHGTVTVTD